METVNSVMFWISVCGSDSRRIQASDQIGRDVDLQVLARLQPFPLMILSLI
jgi:hypothetical protein